LNVTGHRGLKEREDNNTSAEQATVQLTSGPPSGTAQPYLTDTSDTGTAQAGIGVSDRAFTAMVPARATPTN
jgi:hypothetical protein